MLGQVYNKFSTIIVRFLHDISLARVYNKAKEKNRTIIGQF